jgi:hypothetical protein
MYVCMLVRDDQSINVFFVLDVVVHKALLIMMQPNNMRAFCAHIFDNTHDEDKPALFGPGFTII